MESRRTSQPEVVPMSSDAAIANSRIKKLASPVTMATPILKIATFHSGSLGNLVASLPALVTLRDSFPGARICAYARTPLLPLLENFVAVDEVYARPGGGISSQAALMARLHSGEYNLAISFSQGSNALLLTWATGAPIRAGFVPSRMDALLTHKTHKSGSLRPLDALELARSVGATPRGEVARDWLQVPFHIADHAQNLLKENGIERDYIVVGTQSRKTALEEEVSAEKMAKMLREVATRFPLILVGLKNNRQLIREIGETDHLVLDLGGKTDVLTLTALCQTSKGVFGVGCGIIQLGKLFEKPTVAISDSDNPATRALQIFGF